MSTGSAVSGPRHHARGLHGHVGRRAHPGRRQRRRERGAHVSRPCSSRRPRHDVRRRGQRLPHASRRASGSSPSTGRARLRSPAAPRPRLGSVVTGRSATLTAGVSADLRNPGREGRVPRRHGSWSRPSPWPRGAPVTLGDLVRGDAPDFRATFVPTNSALFSAVAVPPRHLDHRRDPEHHEPSRRQVASRSSISPPTSPSRPARRRARSSSVRARRPSAAPPSQAAAPR